VRRYPAPTPRAHARAPAALRMTVRQRGRAPRRTCCPQLSLSLPLVAKTRSWPAPEFLPSSWSTRTPKKVESVKVGPVNVSCEAGALKRAEEKRAHNASGPRVACAEGRAEGRQRPGALGVDARPRRASPQGGCGRARGAAHAHKVGDKPLPPSGRARARRAARAQSASWASAARWRCGSRPLPPPSPLPHVGRCGPRSSSPGKSPAPAHQRPAVGRPMPKIAETASPASQASPHAREDMQVCKNRVTLHSSAAFASRSRLYRGDGKRGRPPRAIDTAVQSGRSLTVLGPAGATASEQRQKRAGARGFWRDRRR
jgi:hypothetical protein